MSRSALRLPVWLAAALTGVTQVEVWLGVIPGPPRPALAALYLVGTAALAWQRVLPVTSLAVSLGGLAVVPALLGVDSNAGLTWFLAALVAVVTAGYYAPRPLLALAVTLGLLGATVVANHGLSSVELLSGEVAYAWLLGAGAWAAGRAIASRNLRAQLAEQRAAHTEQETHWRVAAAAAAERLKIAREMHDVVAHSISVMTLHVSGVRRLLRADQNAERAALELVERTGRESLVEMHRMLSVLRAPEPVESQPAPGLAQVTDLLEPARSAGLKTSLAVTGPARPLPAGVELAAYRIVQEAVTNVLRHAAARRLECVVAYGDAHVELRVVDDGTGALSPAIGGHGLTGMRERAAVYGGTVEAGPRPEGGYAVRAVLPLPEAELMSKVGSDSPSAEMAAAPKGSP